MFKYFTDKWFCYLRQFGFLSACLATIRDILKIALFPHGQICYAQTGEDMVLRNYFSSISNGFYIDVGCNHPLEKSNTYLLYKQGWHGICIDANDTLIAKYARFRPKDIAICSAVSNKAETLNFTIFKDPALSSAQPQHVEQWKKTHPIQKKITIAAMPLNDILTKNQAPLKFDLLSIDVEGLDWQVLQSIDLHKYHPRMILIEMHNYLIGTITQSPIYNHLITHDYRLAAYCMENAYFIDNSFGQ